MKQTLVGLVILVVVLALAMWTLSFRGDEYNAEQEEEQNEQIEQSAFERLQNTTVKVPETNIGVVLTDGSGSYADGPAQGFLTVADDIYAENGDALVVLFVVNSGGSGTFYYLVLFEDDGDVLTQRDEAFLGDRIGVLGLVSDGEGTISVDTLIRGVDEPFVVEPTILETRVFDIFGGTLTELPFGDE